MFFDELTGLRNRRAILQELDMLLAGARRHGHRLSVLMLDVDRFKTINDRFGHLAGDEVLREVARRIAARLRTEDVAGRLGGDELLIVLPDTDAAGAARWRSPCAPPWRPRPCRRRPGRSTSPVSVGSADWQDEELTCCWSARDGALYAAKAAGRDRRRRPMSERAALHPAGPRRASSQRFQRLRDDLGVHRASG